MQHVFLFFFSADSLITNSTVVHEHHIAGSVTLIISKKSRLLLPTLCATTIHSAIHGTGSDRNFAAVCMHARCPAFVLGSKWLLPCIVNKRNENARFSVCKRFLFLKIFLFIYFGVDRAIHEFQ